TLLEKRLITTAGRKAVIGRPILYRTSRDFLMRFGLSDVGELPSLKEFEALARQALGTDEGIAPVEPGEAVQPGELAQPIAAQAEVTPSAEVAANAEIAARADMAAAGGISPSEQALEMAVNEPPMAEVAAPIAAAAAVGSASKPAVAQESSSSAAEQPNDSADGS
ncbi:MAG: SMC-Scp complex subunit ScpB, partial [Terracidiphilus sp.]